MSVGTLPDLSKGVFGIRSLADVRAFVHVAAPLTASAMLAFDFAQGGIIQMIITAIVALTSPALAAANTSDKARTLLYALVLVVGAAAITWNYIDENTWNEILPMVMLVLGGGVASANTPTTLDRGAVDYSVGKHAREIR